MPDIRKRFYHTRVQLYLADMMTLPEECVIVAMPRRGLYMVKNLLRYAHRRINWVQDVVSDIEFNAPDDTNWDTVQAVLAETEGCLMSTCDVSAITEQLICICEALQRQLGPEVIPFSTMQDETVKSVYEYNKQMPDEDYTGTGDAVACAIAQLFYALGYETITEIVLPASRFAFDSLVPAVATLIVTVTGGLGLPAAVGVYLTVELIQELLESGYDASESNLQNWLWSVKNDIVCEAYWQLYAGQPASIVAKAVYDNVIAPSSSISAGDKLICKLFFSAWICKNANIARIQNTTWAQENQIPCYCTICGMLGDHVWTFPPCPNGWTGNGVGCCVDNTIRLRQVFSAWMNNTSPSFEVEPIGEYSVTYQCMLYVDFDLWDFPPDPADRLIRFTLKNVETSQFEAQVDVQAQEVTSPGWNYIVRNVPDATLQSAGLRRMTCAHEDTNALCDGIRISALAVSLEYLG